MQTFRWVKNKKSRSGIWHIPFAYLRCIPLKSWNTRIRPPSAEFVEVHHRVLTEAQLAKNIAPLCFSGVIGSGNASVTVALYPLNRRKACRRCVASWNVHYKRGQTWVSKAIERDADKLLATKEPLPVLLRRLSNNPYILPLG